MYLLQVERSDYYSWILRQYFHSSVQIVRLETVRSIERRRTRRGCRRMIVYNLSEWK